MSKEILENFSKIILMKLDRGELDSNSFAMDEKLNVLVWEIKKMEKPKSKKAVKDFVSKNEEELIKYELEKEESDAIYEEVINLLKTKKALEFLKKSLLSGKE